MSKREVTEIILSRLSNRGVVQFTDDELRALNLSLFEYPHNDVGNGLRLRGRFGRDILYVRQIGWYVWNGKCWCPDGAEDAVRRMAHETVGSIMEEVSARQAKGRKENQHQGDFEDALISLFKWSATSGNRGRIDGMLIESVPYLSVEPDELDLDRFMLNFENGTLSVDGACDELQPHKREDRLAKMMNVEYDPEATCPLFLKFMEEVQPDPEIRRFLQIWAGYCLTGDVGEQKLVFNFGVGGNGKSVFVDLIGKMMGPYSVSLPFTSLVKDDRKRGSEATPDMARLPGARLVRASEPEQGSRFAEATIKQITGGEEITVRHLNQGFFDFDPQFKIMLSGNHKPMIRGQDLGIWRRMLLVPWETNVPPDQQDRKLPDKLWKERAGVLNWLLDGVRLWLEEGLLIPNAVKAATEDYRSDSDPYGRFISDALYQRAGCSVSARDVWDAYKMWCGNNGEKEFSQTALGKALVERGVEKRRSGTVTYIDVELSAKYHPNGGDGDGGDL